MGKLFKIFLCFGMTSVAACSSQYSAHTISYLYSLSPPRDAVFFQIKCETYISVLSMYALKEQPKFNRDGSALALDDYVAKLTLGSGTRGDSGLAVGGGANSVDKSTGFDIVGAGIPLGASRYKQIDATSTRQISFKDVYEDSLRERLDDRSIPLSFVKNCRSDKKMRYNERNNLGIAKYISNILQEIADSPGIVTSEKFVVEFGVTISAGGAIKFVEPTGNIGFGLGGKRLYKEILTIELAREPKK